MRRHGFVAVMAVLALTGCTEQKPAPAPGPAPVTETAAPVTFATTVQEKVPEVAVDRRDEEIEAIADQACASLAAGKDADAVVTETRTLGTADAEAADRATARELVKLAIGTVCPDQSVRAREF